MFDLQQLERAQDIVGAAMPPTPAHLWPLLSERLGATVIVKHENHTPTGAFKVRGGLVYVDRLKRERPQHGWADLGHNRKSRPEHRFRGEPLRHAGDNLRAARQFGRRKIAPCGHSGRTWSSTARIFRSARGEAERRAKRDELEFVPSFHPDLVTGGLRPMRSNFAESAGPGLPLRSDRTGLWYLRLHPGARPARPDHRDRRRAVDRSARLMRCRSRPARS